MTDLTGKLISNTYKQLILVSSAVSNEGVDTSLKPIQTGDGTNTALKVATNAVQVSGALGVTGSVSLDNNLHVDDRVCASAFYGDGSNITGVTATIAGNISVSNAVVGGTLQVSSTATIVGATHLKSTVTVGGAANFGSTVTVEGKAVFKDDVSVSGAANFGSTVTVEGEAIFNNNVSVSGTFNVEGASTFTSKATFNNDVSISGRLDVATSACIGGLAKFKDDVSVSGGLNVGGSVTIAGTNIQATNARVCASAFHGDGSNLTNIQAELGVTTNISVSGFINAGGAVSVSGTFNAVGSSTFKNDVSVSGNLRIGGTTTIAGATSLGSTLDVTGNTSIGGTFLATGKAEFEDDVSVSGNVNIGGTTTIAGAVSLASTLSVGGAANFLSTVTIAGNNVQAANARVCASAYYGDGSNLSGITTSIEGDISVSALTVGGEISVSGGRITIKTSASDPANIRFYCESNNAHYAELRSPPHASYAGNITITLPNTTVTLVGTSTTNTLVNKTFGDKVEFDSDISVSGNSNLVGNVSVGGTFLATGKAEFEDDVSVSGNSNFGGTVTVAGAVSLASTLSVGGASNFGSTVTIAGATSLASTLNVNSNTSIGGTLITTGKAEFEDDVSVSGALIVGGATQLNSTVTVAGAATFEGAVSVSGAVNIAGAVGIGTTSPTNDALLTIKDSGSANPMARISFDSGDSDVSNGVKIGYTAASFAPDFEIANGDAGIIRFKTSDTEALRIDSSQRVNIGTTGSENGYPLHVGSSGNTQMLLKAAANYNSTIAFGDPDSNTPGEIVYAHNGNSMRFNVNGGEKGRFLSGGGLTFNGDTADANALDDYEQGTWTASLDGGTSDPNSAVTQQGAYTKIGNLVFAHALFASVDTTGASGIVQITGWPFAPNLTIPTGNVMSYITFNVNSNTANISPFFASATLLRFYGTLDGANVWVSMQHSAGTGRSLYFSVTYHTNS